MVACCSTLRSCKVRRILCIHSYKQYNSLCRNLCVHREFYERRCWELTQGYTLDLKNLALQQFTAQFMGQVVGIRGWARLKERENVLMFIMPTNLKSITRFNPRMPLRFNIIAAMCDNRGIGIKGTLPWKLKNEMAFFTRMTSDTKEKDKKNAVIMGRLTWESIPPKYKPLPNRLNVIISTTLKDVGNDSLVFSNLNDAINTLSQPPYINSIESVWIVGGSVLYKESLNCNMCHRVYLTNINKSFECDTFFPELPSTKFIEVSDNRVPTGLQKENGITYEFKVYEKCD
ncbi:hypothetical protein O3M35_010654 [Rhynocoris fuscipes]|uniref:dihydrofolate reductase n=1 Tax=Rhynocoris fuscipes TaxID=488301 RepID=A0AAW1D7F3_9HEMI